MVRAYLGQRLGRSRGVRSEITLRRTIPRRLTREPVNKHYELLTKPNRVPVVKDPQTRFLKASPRRYAMTLVITY